MARKRNVRDDLIRCGTELISERGVGALTLRSAGAAAGVSRQAPYHHFGDKEGLLEAIAVRGFTRLAVELMGRLVVLDPCERLVSLGMGYVASAIAEPHLFELMSGRGFTEPASRAAFQRAHAAVEAMLHGAMALHLPRASPAYRSMAVKTSWGLIHGMAHLAIEGAVATDELDWVEQGIRTLANGLRDGQDS